jgi:hypothetical protein
MQRATFALASLLAAVMIVAPATGAEKKIKILIVGGQNNHDWAKSTPFMKGVLDKAGHFETTVCNTPSAKAPADEWNAWQPKFKDFDCVVLDYNGQMWPEPMKQAFVDYIRNGGGAVVITRPTIPLAAGKNTNRWSVCCGAAKTSATACTWTMPARSCVKHPTRAAAWGTAASTTGP